MIDDQELDKIAIEAGYKNWLEYKYEQTLNLWPLSPEQS